MSWAEERVEVKVKQEQPEVDNYWSWLVGIRYVTLSGLYIFEIFYDKKKRKKHHEEQWDKFRIGDSLYSGLFKESVMEGKKNRLKETKGTSPNAIFFCTLLNELWLNPGSWKLAKKDIVRGNLKKLQMDWILGDVKIFSPLRQGGGFVVGSTGENIYFSEVHNELCGVLCHGVGGFQAPPRLQAPRAHKRTQQKVNRVRSRWDSAHCTLATFVTEDF